jgi:gamma-glutamyltranspeptidase/glutathione hydrolase
VLDYMGLTPAGASPAAYANDAEKYHGGKSMLVPGAAGGWLTALEECGRLDRAAVFAPAIEYAEGGVALTLKNEFFFARANNGGYLEPEAKAVFQPGGKVPNAGDIIAQPALAKTFRTLVTGGKDAFYRGPIGQEIVRMVQAKGGFLTEQDLADFTPEWQDTACTSYRGYDVHCPLPPCSGIQYLETLNLVEGDDLGAMGHNSPRTIHLLAEAMKLAVADRIAYSALPGAPTAGLLSKAYAAERRKLIADDRVAAAEGDRFDQRLTGAGIVQPGEPGLFIPECTTHFDVVDSEGNAVAVTQSLGDGFGSGVMAGDTGIMLNDFCYWFDIDPASPNVIAPRKKIEMCMAPAMVFREGNLFLLIGTPGSFGILETTPQMISNVLDHGFSIQAAIEAPRFRTGQGPVLDLEARIPESTRQELTRLGHTVQLRDEWSHYFGGGQGIMIDPDSGALMGGADPRRDGYAIGW